MFLGGNRNSVIKRHPSGSFPLKATNWLQATEIWPSSTSELSQVIDQQGLLPVGRWEFLTLTTICLSFLYLFLFFSLFFSLVGLKLGIYHWTCFLIFSPAYSQKEAHKPPGELRDSKPRGLHSLCGGLWLIRAVFFWPGSAWMGRRFWFLLLKSGQGKSLQTHKHTSMWVKHRYPKWKSGKWKHGLNLRSPVGLILTHTHMKAWRCADNCWQ